MEELVSDILTRWKRRESSSPLTIPFFGRSTSVAPPSFLRSTSHRQSEEERRKDGGATEEQRRNDGATTVATACRRGNGSYLPRQELCHHATYVTNPSRRGAAASWPCLAGIYDAISGKVRADRPEERVFAGNPRVAAPDLGGNSLGSVNSSFTMQRGWVLMRGHHDRQALQRTGPCVRARRQARGSWPSLPF